MDLLIINGPNLNLLGKRETDFYGNETLDEICDYLKKSVEQFNFGIKLGFLQTNAESEIIEKIQSSENYDGVIINAGAYSHYSFAIRDAIASVAVPFVEVHMTNVFAREDFRRKSVISEVCIGTICGFGKDSYLMAIFSFFVKNKD